MYTFTKTGLAPEAVVFRAPGDEKGSNDMSVAPGAAHNLLRPETAESLYVLTVPSHQRRALPGVGMDHLREL